jgi:hypothetical protein
MIDHFQPQPPLPRLLFGALLPVLLALIAVFAAPAIANPTTTFAIFKAGSIATVEHAAWDKLLKTYVVTSPDGINRVAYAKFKAEGLESLEAYIGRLETMDPRTLDRPEQFAFWANLYNAKTIEIVLRAYPVNSIKDINLGGSLLAAVSGGPWKAKVLKVAGEKLSLDDIEHGILRPIFKDPRVHYAVNCASIGCPNLGTEAFTGEKLDAQLNAASTAFVNHARGVRVEKGRVRASSIYSWFQDDFGGDASGVLAHVHTYASEALKRELDGISDIAEYGYDWALNDTRP